MANAQLLAKNQHSTDAWKSKFKCKALKQQQMECVELACLAHAHKEAAAQQAYDAMMFDKQAWLEMMRAGHTASVLQAQVDPTLFP